MWNIFFSKFCGLPFIFLLFLTFYFQFRLSVVVKKFAVYHCFFLFFLLILTFYFQFRLYVVVKKFLKLFFLFYILEILSKNFGKSWNVFSKNIDIWNPKFIINSIVHYLFFYSFSILVILFFLFHLSKLVKNL